MLTKNQKIAIGIVGVVALAGLIIGGYRWRQAELEKEKEAALLAEITPKYQEIELAGQLLRVEVADTDYKITQGLSDRDEIGADAMMFVMPEKRLWGFWMNQMRFNLDFVWIADNEVIAITENVPAPTPERPEPEMLGIDQPTEIILELRASEVTARGIQVGDKLVVK